MGVDKNVGAVGVSRRHHKNLRRKQSEHSHIHIRNCEERSMNSPNMEKGKVEIITEIESTPNDDNHVNENSEKASENASAASDDKVKEDVNCYGTTNLEEAAVKANASDQQMNESDQQINESSQIVQPQKGGDDIIAGSDAAAATYDVNITVEQSTLTQLNHEEEIFNTPEEAERISENQEEEEILDTSYGKCSSTTRIATASSSITSTMRGDSSVSVGTGSGGQVH